MNAFETIERIDTLMTIGQLALVVGCPTAGVTYLVARIAIKEGGKLIAKKALMMAVTAGVTATIAASFLGGKGDGQSDGTNGYTEKEIALVSTNVLIELGYDNRPKIKWEDRALDIEEMEKILGGLLKEGNLTEVEFVNRLPQDGYGEWFLFLQELQPKLQKIKPSAKISVVRDPVDR
jgi:hypothetical protein